MSFEISLEEPSDSAPSPIEAAYIAALSRASVVAAYAAWNAITPAEEACVQIGLRPHSRVLDLGCGAGRFAMYLGGRCASYLGVDASREMITAARTNCPNLHFLEADIVDLPIGVDEFDLILLMGNVLDCLHPYSRRSRLLARCRESIAEGGAIIGSCHLTSLGATAGYFEEDYHGALISNYRASLAEIVSEVESHGLEVRIAIRDYRGNHADWCYWLAAPPGIA